jgi:hypothetical protein
MLGMGAFAGGEFDPAMQVGDVGEMDPAVMGADGVPTERLTERAVIGRGIQAMRLLYRDREEWVESFDSLALGRLPLAVQIEIWFGEPEMAASGVGGLAAGNAVGSAVGNAAATDGSTTTTNGSTVESVVTYPARAPDRVRVIAVPDAAAEAAADESGGGGA